MKFQRDILVLLFICISIPLLSQEKPILSVMDFKGSNIEEQEIIIFVDYITTRVVDSQLFRVIDRSQRETLLQEIEFSLSGCTDEACQLEIGRLLSAKFIIVGSLGRVGTRYLLNMKLIDIETSETTKSASERYTSLDELIDDADRLVAYFIGYNEDGVKRVSEETSGTNDEEAKDTATMDGRSVELVPAPSPYGPDKYSSDNQEYYPKNGVEAAMGYGPGLTVYSAYTYNFSKRFGSGLIAGLYVGEETYYDDSYYEGYYTEEAVYPLFGMKAYYGDKVNGVALSGGIAWISDITLPFIGLYFKNIFVDFSYDDNSESMYIDCGAAISF